MSKEKWLTKVARNFKKIFIVAGIFFIVVWWIFKHCARVKLGNVNDRKSLSEVKKAIKKCTLSNVLLRLERTEIKKRRLIHEKNIDNIIDGFLSNGNS